MATLIDDIQAALDACAPVGKAWPGINPKEDGSGKTAPYIVWLRVVSTDNVSLQGPSNVQNTRVQVDVYARRINDAEAVRQAVDAAMTSSPINGIPLSSQDLYEPAVKLFRIIREFSVWR